MTGSGGAATDARAAAAGVVLEVLDRGRSLTTALPVALSSIESPQDRSLAQELAYGTLRWHPRLAHMIGALLARPLRGKDRDLWALLLVGAYQLTYTAVPPHAAVTLTVAAADALQKGWARGLVNGVLRTYQRRQAELAAAADDSDAGRWAHPPWLKDAIAAAWPDAWQAVLRANNGRPPLTLRVNHRRTDRDTYLGTLAERGITADVTPHGDSGITLRHPVPVTELPGYAEGWFSVQDAGAQLAAPLLEARPGNRILDACCAPGGKTAHLLELYPNIDVQAVDKSPQRLGPVRENLARLGLAAAVTAGDAATPAAWWDGRPFDHILLDAPCSATGVIRRHPDIKALRRPADIPALAELQRRLLAALWPLLSPGGSMVYTTCSILPAENHAPIADFLRGNADAAELAFDVPWGRTPAGGPGRQVLPGDDDMDGFFFARLIKAR